MSDPVIVQEVHRPFVIFGDRDNLTVEPVGEDDLFQIQAPADDERFAFWASCAWSSGCDWYFVALSNGIALFDLRGRGFLCRKRSAMFFDLFLKAPLKEERNPKP